MSVTRERRRARGKDLPVHILTYMHFVNLNMWILSCTHFRKYPQHSITQNSSTYTHLHMLHVYECVHACAYLHPSLFDPGSHATRPATHLTGVSKTEERSSVNEATDQLDPDLVLQNDMLF